MDGYMGNTVGRLTAAANQSQTARAGVSATATLSALVT